jgi:hypothetical protein
VHLLARVYFTQGDLGGIQTIHFAQFLVLPDKKRLLFMGNYDGAFSAYLQDFNNVMGVPAVWSNCVGFPHTFYLVGDGSSDEQRFKAFGRRTQVETIGWYSAYPDLSVKDIGTGTLIRELLRRPIDDRSTLWRRLRSQFRDSATEADCDAALRLV